MQAKNVKLKYNIISDFDTKYPKFDHLYNTILYNCL